ncbi:MAG TPA: HAMP domain-containing protein, partial [Miltoncostaeaceae bacterium]|nr:HAMP domain-containing protein [Miltoncostaeaceae bacterium]
MNLLTRLRMGPRLMAAFGIVAALLTVVAAVAVVSSRSQTAASRDIAERMNLMHDVDELKFGSADFNGWQTAYAFDVARGARGAATDGAPSRRSFLEAAEAFGATLDRLQRRDLTSEQQAALARAKTAYDEFMRVDAEIFALYRRGDAPSRARADALVLGREIELFQSITEEVDTLVTSVTAQGDAAVKAAAATGRQAQIVVFAVAAAALLAAMLLAFLLTRSVTRPLIRVKEAAGRAAEGDLTVRVDATAKDEIGELGRSFDAMIASMRQVVGQV